MPPKIPDIRSLRCQTHGDREAVAKCGSCEGFFCRECILEHEGRMICAACLKASTEVEDTPRNRRFTRLLFRGGLLITAVLTSWLFFMFVGKVLIWIKGGSQWLETL